MTGITDLKHVIKTPVSFHRLSLARLPTTRVVFWARKGGAPFLWTSTPLRNERPEMSGAKPTNCYSERRTKPRKKVARRCVIGSRAEIPRKQPTAQNDAGIARLVCNMYSISCRHWPRGGASKYENTTSVTSLTSAQLNTENKSRHHTCLSCVVCTDFSLATALHWPPKKSQFNATHTPHSHTQLAAATISEKILLFQQKLKRAPIPIQNTS